MSKPLIADDSTVSFDDKRHVLLVNEQPYNYIRFDRLALLKDGFSIAPGAYHRIVGLTDDNRIKIQITAKKVIFKRFNHDGTTLLHIVIPRIKKKSTLTELQNNKQQQRTHTSRKANSIPISQFANEHGGFGYWFGNLIKRSSNGNYYYNTPSGNRRYVTNRVHINEIVDKVLYNSTSFTNRIKTYIN